MRIALIKIGREGIKRYVPLNLMCLASYISQHGHQPILFDYDLPSNRLKYLSGFFKQISEKILKNHPQALGFTVTYNTLPVTLLIAKECKKIAHHIPVIFGGPEVSFEDVELLNIFDQIDIIVRGEGEITLVNVLNALEKSKPFSDISGITYRAHGHIIQNKDRPFIKNLDDLPLLDLSLLPHTKKYDVGQIEAGRGCPFRCTFCSTCRMWKRKFRIKSPQRLALELKSSSIFLKNKSRPFFLIIHDHFLASRKTINDFLSLVEGNRYGWYCFSRTEVLNANTAEKLKRAGCKGVLLGIESGSTEIQRVIRKDLNLSEIPSILNILSRNDIYAILSFIIGFPGERISQINETLSLALSSAISYPSSIVQIYAFKFFKGSEIYDTFKDRFTQDNIKKTMTTPLLTTLPSERSLIKRNPHIFPSFYHIKQNPLDPATLQEACILFTFLFNFFPNTTSLLLQFLSLCPFEAGQKIISFFKDIGAKFQFYEGKLLLTRYLPFFRSYIRKYSDASIRRSFLKEELYIKSSFCN